MAQRNTNNNTTMLPSSKNRRFLPQQKRQLSSIQQIACLFSILLCCLSPFADAAAPVLLRQNGDNIEGESLVVSHSRQHRLLERIRGVERIRGEKRIRGLQIKPKPQAPTTMNQQRRLAPPKGGGGGGGSSSSGSGGSGSGGHSGSHSYPGYIGCLGLSSEELTDSWIFPGTAPSCQYTCHSGSGSGGGGGDGTSDNSTEYYEELYDGETGDMVRSNEDFDNVNENDDTQYYSGYGGNNKVNGGSGSAGSGGDDGDSYYSPYADFEIDQCDTYQNLWLWDLALTCDSQDNLENCECPFAEEMLSKGLISCDDASKCPSNCFICSTCMRLLGCVEEKDEENPAAPWRSVNYMYMLGALAAILLFITTAYIITRSATSGGALDAYLMEDDGVDDFHAAANLGAACSPTGVTALNLDNAPGKTFSSYESSDDNNSQTADLPVYLSPVVGIQFEPSNRAAIESDSELSSSIASRSIAKGGFGMDGGFAGADISADGISSDGEPKNIWLAPVAPIT